MVLGRRIDYLSPTLYLTDVLVVSLLVCWFIGSFASIKAYVLKNKEKTLIRNTIPLILVLFAVVNVFFAASRPVAMYSWIKFLEYFLLGWYIVKTKPKFERIVFFLSVSILYSAGVAIFQFLFQHSLGGVFWWLGERTFDNQTPGIAQIPICFLWAPGCPLFLRAYATFPHPNVLGGYIAVLLPLILNKLTNLQSNKVTKQQKFFYYITIILAAIALTVTFSRSAWAVGVLGAGMWYLVFRKKRKFVFPRIPYIKPSILILVLFVVCFTVSIVLPRFLGDSESVVVREQLNTSAVSLIGRYPLFGVGLGNFLVTLPLVSPLQDGVFFTART